VGSYAAAASPYGALDMAGNVSEWVSDWYDAGYYARSPRDNPTGAESGPGRGLRGGSWDLQATFLRSAYRYWANPADWFVSRGFRCAAAVDGR
jgi:formylglycine-generating enzyme required for sulfatase activity